jgi:hypothetical protein
MVQVHSQDTERGSFHALVGALERAPSRNGKGAPSRNGRGHAHNNGGGYGGNGNGGGDDGDDLGPLGRALLAAFKRSSELQSELVMRSVQTAIEGAGETNAIWATGLGEALARALNQNADLAEQLAALAERVATLERQLAAPAGDRP